MRPPADPIFLERESYRRRRLSDAAKLVPVIGLVLFALPVIWATTGGTAYGLIYLFAVWGLLIVVNAILSRRLMATEPQDDASPDEDA